MKRLAMTTARTIVLTTALLLSIAASAQNNQTGGSTHRVDPLPRDLEVQLALSALPPHLRNGATVYVLNPDKGFEVARRGANGFHALVARTGDDAFRGTWPLSSYRSDILYPVSFDQAGADANMKVFLDAAEMQAKGTPPQELKRLIQDRFKTNYYKAPARAGISYMLAPIQRTYADPDESGDLETINFPHVMTYAPNVDARDVGAATVTPEEGQYLTQHGRWRETPYPQLHTPGPHGYMIHARGKAETEAITREYQSMLARLCTLKKEWCLRESKPGTRNERR
jgi:hypothetical protein